MESYALGIPKRGAKSSDQPDKCGDDSFFISKSNNKNKSIIGIADGVGGWRDFNIDPSIFARKLMLNAYDIAFSSFDSQENINPQQLMECAYNKIKNNKEVEAGSSTCCIATFDYQEDHTIVKTSSIGDSGYIILRGKTIIFRSILSRSELGAPPQLSIVPDRLSNIGIIQTPINEAINNEHILVKDDIIIMATDGLWDNVYNLNDLIDNVCSMNQNNLPIQDIAGYLIVHTRICFSKPDDVTVIIGRITN